VNPGTESIMTRNSDFVKRKKADFARFPQLL
jgi:hypothetical protein